MSVVHTPVHIEHTTIPRDILDKPPKSIRGEIPYERSSRKQLRTTTSKSLKNYNREGIVYEADFELQGVFDDLKGRLNSLSFTSVPAPLVSLVGGYRPLTNDFTVKLIEDLLILIKELYRCKSMKDFAYAATVFAKLRTEGSLLFSIKDSLTEYFESICREDEFEVQSFSDLLGSARSLLERFDEVCKSKIYKKLYRMFLYAMSFSLFDKLGVDLKFLNYTKMEKEALRKEYYIGTDFMRSVLDTLLFVCERGHQCIITGTIDPLFHSEDSYGKWCERVALIKNRQEFLSVAELHGFSIFEYFKDLDSAIEDGESMLKHVSIVDPSVTRYVRVNLADLVKIKMTVKTTNFAQQDRKAPFAVLIYGDTSVGKSSFTNILFSHYGKIFDLPIDPTYKYTRNSADKFWSGFNSSQWCLQLDDVAFIAPESKMEDLSLMELISIQNNVPFVPNQADLKDKGKTPLLSKFVIATTNTEHLNATAYFSCPAAIQRRLPFIFELMPKPEFCSEDMLDKEKVTLATANLSEFEYPNFWNIRVKRVVPQKRAQAGVKQRAKVIHFKDFDDVYVFLQWFSQTAKNYELEQISATTCNDHVRDVPVCKNCYLPLDRCCCNVELQMDLPELTIYRPEIVHLYVESLKNYHSEPELKNPFKDFVNGLGFTWWMLFLWLYFCVPFVAWISTKLFGRDFLYNRIERSVYSKDLGKKLIMYGGNYVHRKIGKYMIFVEIVAVLTTGAILVKLIKFVAHVFSNKVIPEKVEPQGNYLSKEIGRPMIAVKKERENVWYNDEVEITSFDVSPQSLSYKTLSFDQIKGTLLRNCVSIICRDLAHTREVKSRAFCVGGFLYLATNHTIPQSDNETNWERFELEIIETTTRSGVSRNYTIQVSQSDFKRFPERELVSFEIRATAPKTNFVPYIAKKSNHQNFNGYLVRRNGLGEFLITNVRNCTKVLQRVVHYPPFINDQVMDIYEGVPDVKTEVGDCGAILCSTTEHGFVIHSLHFGLNHITGKLWSTCIDHDFIVSIQESAVEVQAGCPVLCAPSANQELTDLHFKSPFRYFPVGTAVVYGSLLGHRGKPKSQVKRSPLCDSLLKRGFVLRHGAPVMSGKNDWVPKRLALEPMINPDLTIDKSILKEVAQDFAAELLSSLSNEDLEMIHVVDDFTAINGAAGIAFVDKIKRKTSAGFPWGRVKEFFLTHLPPQDGLSDPVEVDDEIMDRVSDMIEKYESGTRVCPIFKASLKDEPTKFAKIESGKTRVFAGAPFDWTIVVRKYLLGFMRVMYNNRFHFESAPGINATSTEWEDFYNHLTQFGKDRMVAGDYANFDKSMIAEIVMTVFDVIKTILKAAGYSPIELRVVSGIAVDTAYPYMDFFGDIIQFFGTNPSGNPLTVLINGLANCLYMRYCFYLLNPKRTAKDFKKSVSLMTYGDDNIMGVSPKCPWFNHSSIAQVLRSIGVVYTMADKLAISVPYIDISECSFLKRAWRWDSDVKAYLAPLEWDSIEKMLLINVRSKSICSELQCMQCVQSALREAFHHGKDKFQMLFQLLKEVVDENGLTIYCSDCTFRDWDYYVECFRLDSRFMEEESE